MSKVINPQQEMDGDEHEYPRVNLLRADEIQALVKSTELWQPPSVSDIEAQKKRQAEQQQARAENQALSSAFKVEVAKLAPELDKLKNKAYQEAYDAGFKQGLQEGKKQGLAHAQQELAQAVADAQQQWQHLLAGLESPLKHLQQELWQSLSHLAMTLAQGVLNTQIQLDPSLLTKALEQLVEELPDPEQSLTIQLSPRDFALVEPLTKQDPMPQWQLQLDPQLSPGLVILRTQNTQLDFDLQGRLHDLIESWMRQSSDALATESPVTADA